MTGFCTDAVKKDIRFYAGCLFGLYSKRKKDGRKILRNTFISKDPSATEEVPSGAADVQPLPGKETR